MGRLEGQIPESVKKDRVEELMLAQQEIAFEKARKKVGEKVEVLIDRRMEDGKWVGRTGGQAPEIDSVTFVDGKELHAGKMVTATVSKAEGYDLIAGVGGKRSRSLKVVG